MCLNVCVDERVFLCRRPITAGAETTAACLSTGQPKIILCIHHSTHTHKHITFTYIRLQTCTENHYYNAQAFEQTHKHMY